MKLALFKRAHFTYKLQCLEHEKFEKQEDNHMSLDQKIIDEDIALVKY